MNDIGSRTAPLPSPRVNAGLLAWFGNAFAGLFVAQYPAQREGLLHWTILAAIICVGVVARFWGLGNVGLHGDEETMAMAVMHIVKDGTPILPSGMFYPRGMTQLYLMAASVNLFGETEWALRLPSALCGVALIPLTYLAARRFLRPEWNLALAATVALLPELIVYSQTARMYIFLLAAIAVYMTCIFAWERTGRTRWLVAALVAFAFGVDFHALTVTLTPLLLFPGAVSNDSRKLLQGAVAAVVAGLTYLLINGWVEMQYPVPSPEFAADLPPPLTTGVSFAPAMQIALWGAGVLVAFAAVQVSRSILDRTASISMALLMLAGLVCQLTLMYHIAGLLLFAGFVVAKRHHSRNMRQLWIFAAGSALIALIHVTLLADSPRTIVQIVGAMVGQPSVWPYVKVAAYSPIAALLALGALIWGAIQISKRQPAPDYSLFLVMGVWAPMCGIGLVLWHMPTRYTAGSLLPLLMCAFAFAQYAVSELRRRKFSVASPRWEAGAAALLSVAIINPVAAAAALNTDYSRHPDHKGAAEFIRSQNITPEDVLLAEDVLQQTYYLGAVDYWFTSKKNAQPFVHHVNGKNVDFYTGSPVVSTAAELNAVLERERGRRIFIIGSGESREDNRLHMRGPELQAALASDQFTVVYTGRDGFTRVWRAEPTGGGSNEP